MVVEEEWREEHLVQENGRTRREERFVWRTIAMVERSTDFYLQDGEYKVFVNGANRAQIKVHGDLSAAGGESIFSIPPPGIAAIIAESVANHSWGVFGGRTGRFRHFEWSFDVNELVCALGVVTPAVDPFSGQNVKQLLPIRTDVLNQQFFDSQGWQDWDRRAWVDLTSIYPSVLISDDKSMTMCVQVQPIPNLPQWMLVVNPQWAVAQPQPQYGQPQPQYGQPQYGQPQSQYIGGQSQPQYAPGQLQPQYAPVQLQSTQIEAVPGQLQSTS